MALSSPVSVYRGLSGTLHYLLCSAVCFCEAASVPFEKPALSMQAHGEEGSACLSPPAQPLFRLEMFPAGLCWCFTREGGVLRRGAKQDCYLYSVNGLLQL